MIYGGSPGVKEGYFGGKDLLKR